MHQMQKKTPDDLIDTRVAESAVLSSRYRIRRHHECLVTSVSCGLTDTITFRPWLQTELCIPEQIADRIKPFGTLKKQ
jgi:hypothetical protein